MKRTLARVRAQTRRVMCARGAGLYVERCRAAGYHILGYFTENKVCKLDGRCVRCGNSTSVVDSRVTWQVTGRDPEDDHRPEGVDKMRTSRFYVPSVPFKIRAAGGTQPEPKTGWDMRRLSSLIRCTADGAGPRKLAS